MAIKFTCPNCKKAFTVSDQLAGKRAACSGCKHVITIPAPVSKPADVEEYAAAALTDRPATPAAPAQQPTTIDFRCPMCDEQVSLGVELAGKQSSCPKCRRIIKVPKLVKEEAKDWRKAESHLPSGARRDDQPAPVGAWGTATTGSRVSREALLEAGAIPEVRERWTLQQKIKRGVAAAASLAVVGVAIWWGMSAWAQGKQSRAFARAEALLKEGKVASREAAAELHRAIAEYLLRENRVEEARTQLANGVSLLTRDLSGSSERDATLLESALCAVDIGNDPTEGEKGAKVKREDTVLQTMRNIRAPEAQQEALREITRKFIAKGQPERAVLLAGQLSAGEEGGEMPAIVGLELLRTGQAQLAGQLAEQGLLPLRRFLATKPKHVEGDGGASGQTPFVPSLVALCLALDKRDQAVALAPEPKGTAEPSPVFRVGFAEGLARKGDWVRARKNAGAPGATPARVQAFLAIAGVALEKGQADEARRNLEAAATIVESEGKGKPVPLWLQYRLVKLMARVETGERTERMASAINDPALRGRAQLETLRNKLAALKDPADDTLLGAFGKDSLAYSLGLEMLARHNARLGQASAVQKDIESREPEAVRAFGYVGLALGMQDHKQ